MDEKKAYIHIIFLIFIKYIFNNFAYNYIPQLNFGGDQWKILINYFNNIYYFFYFQK